MIVLMAPVLPLTVGAQVLDAALPRRVQLGASLGAVPESLLAIGSPAGAAVLGVIAGSAAAGAGIQPGDIVVRIDRDTVRSVPEALSLLRPLTGSRRITVTLLRSRERLAIEVPLRERPKESSNEFTIDYRSVVARGGRHRVLIAHPNDGRPHPAVLLIGGIGCYSIDAPSGPLAYRDLAYHLTRRGYTTVRVEKLGIGDSDGASCLGPDLETEIDGYRQALIAMKTYPSVDSSRVFLFGHSIGGLEAPLLAGEGPPLPRIRGVAVLSTAGVSWYEYELANLRRQLELQDFPPDSIEAFVRAKTICGYHFLVEKQSHDTVVSHDSACARLLGYPASDAYMHSVADLAPSLLWKKVTASALIMYGSSDFVTSRVEHLQLTDYINAMHPGGARYADIAETDHYISHQASPKASISDPIPNLSRPYYGAALELVIDRWLDELSGLPRGGFG
jgi:hypothetical protein